MVTAIEPNKRTVYLGEPLVLTYRIYNRYNNLDVRNYDIPELEGFWKETVDAPEARWEPQLINGKRYNVATVRQVVAFPQQTGTFVLEDFNLKGYLRINFFEGRDVQATCDPVEITVPPIPENAPGNSLPMACQPGRSTNPVQRQRVDERSHHRGSLLPRQRQLRNFLREPKTGLAR